MRKLITLIFTLITFNGYGQISVEYLNIVTSSANYTYVGIQYQPDYNWATADTWNNLQNGLNALTAMYERGWGIINGEYIKLRDLQLLNVNNKKALLEHQKKVDSWADTNISKIDFSKQENVNSVLNYFTWIYKLPTVRDEIRLLNEINELYQFVLASDPNKVNKGLLYDHLNMILLEMRFWNGDQLSRSLNTILLEIGQREYTNYKNIVNKKYSNITQFSKVSDGWHYVYVLGKSDNFFGRNNVYVSNGKATLFRGYNGVETKIISGGTITNQHCKSAIYSFMDSFGAYRDAEVEFYFLD